MVAVVVMGVCGCGKTTVGEALAKRLNWDFRDADDFHSEGNKQKMSSGVPLTDEDRMPWLIAIHDCIKSSQTDSSPVIVTCSALKRWYRDVLRSGETAVQKSPESSASPAAAASRPSAPNVSSKVLFVLLSGSIPVLQSRLAGRKGHFMNPDLLTSQLAILEEPGLGEIAMVLDIDDTVSRLVDAIVERLQQV